MEKRYILPEKSLNYWSLGNLNSRFDVPLIGEWTDPRDNTPHYFAVTFDDRKYDEMAFWEATYIDGELRYVAVATKILDNDTHLRAKAQDMATWIFTSKQPDALPGLKFF